MEFPFDVTSFLPERITKVRHNCKFLSHNFHRGFGSTTNVPSLPFIIDKMGEASSKAQGLNHVITSSFKLQSSSDQTLYIMRDTYESKANTVVGIMKVGYKNLFVIDVEGRQNETRTLCVLDFYVHESLQRKGYGRELFEFVIQDLNVNPRHLAIDRPSDKFQQFLAKHYNMRGQIPQANNFVVYHGFFRNRPRSSTRQSRFSGGSGRPPVDVNRNTNLNNLQRVEDSASDNWRKHNTSSALPPVNMDQLSRPPSGCGSAAAQQKDSNPFMQSSYGAANSHRNSSAVRSATPKLDQTPPPQQSSYAHDSLKTDSQNSSPPFGTNGPQYVRSLSNNLGSSGEHGLLNVAAAASNDCGVRGNVKALPPIPPKDQRNTNNLFNNNSHSSHLFSRYNYNQPMMPTTNDLGSNKNTGPFSNKDINSSAYTAPNSNFGEFGKLNQIEPNTNKSAYDNHSNSGDGAGTYISPYQGQQNSNALNGRDTNNNFGAGLTNHMNNAHNPTLLHYQQTHGRVGSGGIGAPNERMLFGGCGSAGGGGGGRRKHPYDYSTIGGAVGGPPTTLPTSYNIFGTMPLPNKYNNINSSQTQSPFRTRLW